MSDPIQTALDHGHKMYQRGKDQTITELLIDASKSESVEVKQFALQFKREHGSG